MNIGIDIDGVILDFQDRIRVYSEWYNSEVYNKKDIKKKDEIKVWRRYDWNKDEVQRFIEETFIKVAKESQVIPFAQEIIAKLKENNKIIIITARGDFAGMEMIEIAKKQLEDANIKFDKIYWNASDKVKICKEEKIDYMIDDYADVCEDLSNNNINTIYFRAKDNRILQEGRYLKEVSNWAEIYRYIDESKN